MRVLHFAKYAFVRTGGMERHVETLTRALAARGVDVTVLAYDPSGQAAPQRIDGVRVEPVPTLLRVSSQALAPALAAHARRLARATRFDVVHQHWPDPFAHVAASWVPGGPAQVVTWHMDIVRQRVLGSLYRTLAPWILTAPDAVIGATAAHLRSAQIDRFAPPDRRHVIPFGIDAAAFAANPQRLGDAARLRSRHGGGPIVFALGRHVYYKGFDVLIRAMERVPAVLLLGGEGPLTPRLRELASRVGDRVRLVGSIPEGELPTYFHACDLFCLPSVARTEAFGLVQAEAMVCGKPLVNTALGTGVNELAPAGTCALTVPPGDADALADALGRLLADPAKAAALGAAGRARILEGFTIEAMAQRTIELYESVLARRARPT